MSGKGADFWVDYIDLNSDHHLIGAVVDSPRTPTRRRGRKKPRRRFKMDVMIQRSSSEDDVKAAKDSRDQYEACLDKAFAGYKPEDMKATSCDCVATYL